MPPEQSRGEHDRVGPRSDVFGLGAVLCEILTGKPPFDTIELVRAGDIAPARERLRASGADPELIELAVGCLAPDPADRPADAGAVAAAVEGYQARLRERLREAELAKARAAAERKARRRTEALRLIGVAAVVAVVVGGWAWSRWQSELARDVNAALEEGRSVREEMVRVGGNPARLAEAERAARRAEGLLRGVVGRVELRGQVAELQAELQADARDPGMVRSLEEIRLKCDSEGRPHKRPEIDAAFAATFADYGIDVTTLDPTDAAARINRRAVRAALVTAIDTWGQECLGEPKLEARGRHLFAVAGAADPDPWRARLRAALLAKDTNALTELAREALTLDQPTSTLVALGAVVALRSERPPTSIRESRKLRPEGIELLREARRRAPGDFWANYQLATVMDALNRHDEAILSYCVAIALRPELMTVRYQLVTAYAKTGDMSGVMAVCQDAVALYPRSFIAHGMLGVALARLGEFERALFHLRTAHQINPGLMSSPTEITSALEHIGAWDEAVASRKDYSADRRLSPHDQTAALRYTGQFEKAAELLRKAYEEAGNPPGTVPALQQADALAELARRLPVIEAGTDEPRDPAEWGNVIMICYFMRKDHTAVQLAERAVGAEQRTHVMYGVYSAVRVGSGPDIAGVDAVERARCRGLALAWLQAALNRRSTEARGADPQRTRTVRQAVAKWKYHRDLAPVRGDALAKLPESERAAWEKFWRDVDDLIRSIDEPASAPGGRLTIPKAIKLIEPQPIPLSR